jgi:hypothetical protein
MAAFTTTSGTTYDYTDPTVNKDAVQTITPVEGRSFLIRNRIDFGTLGHQSAEAGVANIFKVLEIPARAMVQEVMCAVVPGSATLTHAFSSAASLGASAGKSAAINVTLLMNKSASASSTLTPSSAAFRTVVLTKNTGAVTTAANLPVVSASTPWTAAVTLNGASADVPVGNRYGGFVALFLTGSSASSVSGKFSGKVDFFARCMYMPE